MLRIRTVALVVVLLLLGAHSRGRGDEPPARSEAYLAFVKAVAAELRQGDAAPKTLDEWTDRRASIRRNLIDALGGFPAQPCPLDAKVLGTLQRDGYRVEKVVFQTRTNVWMTANLYLPDSPGRHPAILNVHGHWPGAKQDPTVQTRCIGAVKLGFVALVVDAFGAGERGIGKALGEYHGATTGAALLPVGLPLAGLQAYENRRAVDYLQTRPEVDPDRIGITGASGGGNQTMYAGALDDRLKAVVPVCSVGNYPAYLGTGCCLCEVVPGALRFTDEWSVLGQVAPRALMVVSASQDSPQFSVAEAKKSLALAAPIFSLYKTPENVRHTIINSKHDYNKAMREAMYGWMTRHLKGEGDGRPIAEPEVKTEDPETLRCYPGETRPDDWMTIPRFAAAEGRRLLAARPRPQTADAWKADQTRRQVLLGKVIEGNGPGKPRYPAPNVFRSETKRKDGPVVILIGFETEAQEKDGLAARLLSGDDTAESLELCATGRGAWPGDRVRQAFDHNSAEWGLWIGRPLLTQWVRDLSRSLDDVQRGRKAKGANPEIILIGKGQGALVALCAGAVDPRVTQVVAIDLLASYLTEKPYSGHAIGLMVPGILREVGDIAEIAALNAPKRLVIAGGVSPTNERLTLDQLRDTFQNASRGWSLLGKPENFTLLETADADEILRTLTR